MSAPVSPAPKSCAALLWVVYFLIFSLVSKETMKLIAVMLVPLSPVASKSESWFHLSIHLHHNSGYFQICSCSLGKRWQEWEQSHPCCGSLWAAGLVELPSPLAEEQDSEGHPWSQQHGRGGGGARHWASLIGSAARTTACPAHVWVEVRKVLGWDVLTG